MMSSAGLIATLQCAGGLMSRSKAPVVGEAELAAAAAARDPVGGADVGEGEAEGEWTEAAPGSCARPARWRCLGARGAAQRCALMRAGAVDGRAGIAVFEGDGWVKGGAAWWHAVREGSALQLVRVLLGSCAPPVADHEDSGAELCAVRDGNVLAQLHALEGASGTRQLGGCAEELLDALSAGVDATGGLAAPAPGSARVSALRLATRESNCRRAEERRASLLAELGFERRTSGVSVGSAVSPSPVAGTSPMDALDIGSAGSSALASTPPGSDGTAAISIPMASTPPSSGAMMATVVASPISARSLEFEAVNVDDLEDEEDGDLCVVCREDTAAPDRCGRRVLPVPTRACCGWRPWKTMARRGRRRRARGAQRTVGGRHRRRRRRRRGGSPSMLSLQSAFVSTSLQRDPHGVPRGRPARGCLAANAEARWMALRCAATARPAATCSQSGRRRCPPQITTAPRLRGSTGWRHSAAKRGQCAAAAADAQRPRRQVRRCATSAPC